MTHALACEPAPIISSNHFRILNIGEPVEVRVGVFSSAADLNGCLEELRQLEVASLHVVLHCPEAAMKALRATCPPRCSQWSADHLSLVWVPEGPASQAITYDDLWYVCHASRGNLYLTEPDPTRAVVGTMQWLRDGDAFALLWPVELGFKMAENLVIQGQRWRATLEQPEGGEFHHLPPAADERE